MLLIGAGPMAVDHSKVLDALNVEYTVIGRSKNSAMKFESATGHRVVQGGLAKYISSVDQVPNQAIVSVGVEELAESTKLLILKGVKYILLEKPAGLTIKEITDLSKVAKNYNATVYVAYNRRFFSSVLNAQKIIQEDGGVQNFTFEITEWGHTIEPLEKAPGVKENWFLGNTSHIVDLAFHLGGLPKSINCYTSGKLPWHNRSAIFAGSGESQNGALFSYQGNWGAPGRWSLDIITQRHRLIFKPLEKLQIQQLGSIAIEEILLDDKLDHNYKSGLYMQFKSFIQGANNNLCSLEEHVKNCLFYENLEFRI